MALQVVAEKVHINNCDFYYEHFVHPQHKETIVLIHGFLSSLFCFRKIVPLLTEHFNVLMIDYPPFGKSGKTKKFQYGYTNIAKSIWTLLEQLKIERIYLAGHSMGGQIALHMILQNQKGVEKAILLCSSAYVPRMKPALVFFSYLPFFEKFIKRHLGKTGVLGNLHSVVYDRNMIDEEMIEGYLAPFRDDEIFIALKKMIRDFEGDLPKEKLEQIQVPCLLIWGDSDRIVPLELGKQLAEEIPNSKLVILEKTGHLLPEEKPEDVTQAIVTFLKE